MNLFAEQEQQALADVQPLAVRMRPRTLDEFIGQDAILGPGKLLGRLLEANCITSAILHGPPGCGKTTLARLIAHHTDAVFAELHASEAGVKDVRQLSAAARDRLLSDGRRTVLFLDEVHRFNRAQQDALLRDVEEGILILIGATTENPYFAINSPLISRSQVFEFQPLDECALAGIVTRALTDAERGLGRLHVTISDDGLALLAARSDGDARRALAALEIAAAWSAEHAPDARITRAIIADSSQRKPIRYDRAGDAHYDIASALIKSMRGSDPDASLHWLARMLEGGEDPRFIARRIAIAASEDVGNADPQAAILAAAAMQITEQVGLPECQFALAQAAVYIACAPKSDAVTRAIAAARADVRDGQTISVPPHLAARPADRSDADDAGDAPAAYRSPHDSEDGFLVQDYLGAVRRYYNPTHRGYEQVIATRLSELRERIAAARARPGSESADQKGVPPTTPSHDG